MWGVDVQLHALTSAQDDVNLQVGSLSTLKKTTECTLFDSDEAGREINAQTVVYMFISRRQKAGQNCDVKTAIKSFENVAEFICFGTTLTSRNCMHEEIKSTLNSGEIVAIKLTVVPSAA